MGTNLELIPYSQNHFYELSTWFTDDQSVVLWAGPKYRHPVEESDIQRMLCEPSSNKLSRFAWTATVENSIAGHSQLAFNWAASSALLCRVAVSPAFRGMGYAKPMLSLILQEVFRHQDIQEVELNVFTFNETAISVYGSLGFTNIGILKPPLDIGKDRWDTYTMRLPRSVWIQTGG